MIIVLNLECSLLIDYISDDFNFQTGDLIMQNFIIQPPQKDDCLNAVSFEE